VGGCDRKKVATQDEFVENHVKKIFMVFKNYLRILWSS
jgi:hypothetical protein